ncbi:hypothetical protein ACFYT4_34165 [Streptomyces sp. NPDC004609]|uniref:hypothetical protein n=1 Tax=Streptomyces sp. NPDC004609 TaxID=3364704 RepID=UPI0036BB0DA2
MNPAPSLSKEPRSLKAIIISLTDVLDQVTAKLDESSEADYARERAQLARIRQELADWGIGEPPRTR